MNPIYTNGAALYNENGVGKLAVKTTQEVENLNSEFLQGKHASDFLGVGEGYGITQSGKTMNLTGTTENKNNVTENVEGGTKDEHNVTETLRGLTKVFDTASVIKIGNLVIKSSDNGNGILVGIE